MNPEVMGVLRESTEPSTDDIDNVLESQTGVKAHHDETGDLILEGQPWQLSIAEAFLMDKYNDMFGDEAVMVKGSGKTTGKYFARSATVLKKDIDISMTDDSTSHDSMIIQESIQPSFMHTTNMSETVMKEPSDVSDESTSEVSMPPEWAQVNLRKTMQQLDIPVSDSSNEQDVAIPETMLPLCISSIRSSVDLQYSNEATSELLKPPEWAKVSLRKTVPHARDDFSIQESEKIIATQPGSVRKSINKFERKDMEATIPLKRTPSKKKTQRMPKPRIKIPVDLFTRQATTAQNSNSFPNDDDVSPSRIVQTLETTHVDELYVNTRPSVNADTVISSNEKSVEDEVNVSRPVVADDDDILNGDAYSLQTLCELLFDKRPEITPSSVNVSVSPTHNSSISDFTISSTCPDSPHTTSCSSSSISGTIALQDDLENTKRSDISSEEMKKSTGACPLCMDICNEPVRLKCVHSSCETCLQRYETYFGLYILID